MTRREAVAIAVGGALGAPARYGMAHLLHDRPGHFPWATFVTNVSGSLAIGVVLAVVGARSPLARRFLATGFLGAYTTYSTFAVQGDLLVHDGHPLVAAAYTVASLVAGLAAVLVGLRAGRRVAAARASAKESATP